MIDINELLRDTEANDDILEILQRLEEDSLYEDSLEIIDIPDFMEVDDMDERNRDALQRYRDFKESLKKKTKAKEGVINGE